MNNLKWFQQQYVDYVYIRMNIDVGIGKEVRFTPLNLLCVKEESNDHHKNRLDLNSELLSLRKGNSLYQISNPQSRAHQALGLQYQLTTPSRAEEHCSPIKLGKHVLTPPPPLFFSFLKRQGWLFRRLIAGFSGLINHRTIARKMTQEIKKPFPT